MRFLIISLFCFVALGCSGSTTTPNSTANAAKNSNSTPAKAGPLPVYGYEVVKAYPHDPNAFTEGLFFHNGFMYESTGGSKAGESSIRKVDIETGKVLQKWDLPADDFGEGTAIIGDKIYQLTWQKGLARVFDATTFKVLKEFNYQGDGWGMTTDGTNLYFTQSTHVIKVVDPETFKTIKTIPVMKEDGSPLMQINELEWIKGEIWGNIWHSEQKEILGKPNYIARINPTNGKLLGWIDLAGISPDDVQRDSENTLNGIAYDPATDRIFVTGKKWKKLFEIKLTGPK